MLWLRVPMIVLAVSLASPAAYGKTPKKGPPTPRVEAVTFTGLGDFRLPGRVTVPGDVSDAAVERVVVLIHGSGPQDMDEDLTTLTEGGQPNRVFEILASALVGEGFATVQYDKRSYVVRQILETDLAYMETPEFAAFDDDALRYLVEDAAAVARQARERFPAARIHLLGHSQGTYIGLQVAAEHDWIAGVAMIGFYGARLETMAFEQVVYRSLYYFQDIDADGDGRLTPQEMGGHPMGKLLAEDLAPIDPDGDGHLSETEFMGASFSNLILTELIPSTYTRRETQYPLPGAAVAGLDIPLVFFVGLLDNQTPAYHTMAVQATNEVDWHKPNLTFRYYEGLGHALDPREGIQDLTFRPVDTEATLDLASILDERFTISGD